MKIIVLLILGKKYSQKKVFLLLVDAHPEWTLRQQVLVELNIHMQLYLQKEAEGQTNYLRDYLFL